MSTDARDCEHIGAACVTCADEAIAMRVLELAPALEPARCIDAGGGVALVLLDLVQARIGDEVLVHGGVAIARTAAA